MEHAKARAAVSRAYVEPALMDLFTERFLQRKSRPPTLEEKQELIREFDELERALWASDVVKTAYVEAKKEVHVRLCREHGGIMTTRGDRGCVHAGSDGSGMSTYAYVNTTQEAFYQVGRLVGRLREGDPSSS